MGAVATPQKSYMDYVSENVETSMKYIDYVSENIDKSISYIDYLVDYIDNGINFKEPIRTMKIVPSTNEPEPKIVENESGFGLWCKINKTSNDFWKYKL